MGDAYGTEDEDELERLAKAIQEDTVRIGQVEPYQAYRAGFHVGGVIVMTLLHDMIAKEGLSVEQVTEGLRKFWSRQIQPWAEAPTCPGQEIMPEIDLGRRWSDE